MVRQATLNGYTAQLAVSEHDRMAASRIRYTVYVAEQGKPYLDADHQRRTLSDNLDSSATIILVTGETGPCGTVRANFLDSGGVRAAFEHHVAFTLFAAIPESSIAVCSRLAVLPEHRGRVVSGLLFLEIYRYGLGRNTQLCFEACAPSLVPIFRRYGFREYLSPIIDSIVGQLHRMVLVLDDLAHLGKVRSPFLAIAEEQRLAHQTRPWLDRQFEQFATQSADDSASRLFCESL